MQSKKLDIAAALAKKYGELEIAPLEDAIDSSNIHGWLEERVSLVEYRLAEVVTIILDASATAKEEFQKATKSLNTSDKYLAILSSLEKNIVDFCIITLASWLV